MLGAVVRVVSVDAVSGLMLVAAAKHHQEVVGLSARIFAEPERLGFQFGLHLVGVGVLHLKFVRIVDERLLQVAHYLLPNRLLHAQVALQRLHVAAGQRSVIVALLPRLLLRLDGHEMAVAVRVDGWTAAVDGAAAASVLRVRRVVVEREDVPQVRNRSLGRHNGVDALRWTRPLIKPSTLPIRSMR